MTKTTFTPPTDAEMQQIMMNARRLRAETMREMFRRLRGSFSGRVGARRPSNAH